MLNSLNNRQSPGLDILLITNQSITFVIELKHYKSAKNVDDDLLQTITKKYYKTFKKHKAKIIRYRILMSVYLGECFHNQLLGEY